MWKQTNIPATITGAAMLTALVGALVDPGSGWVVHDDQRASNAVALRNNRGAGRDQIIRFSTWMQGSNVRVGMKSYVTWNPETHTGTFEVDYGWTELLPGTAVTLSVAETPDYHATALWFTQGTTVKEPWLVASIDQHRDPSGALVNLPDDGSIYPLWGGLARDLSTPERLLNTLHHDNADAPDAFRNFRAGHNRYTHTFFFSTGRTPLGPRYLMHGPGYRHAHTYDSSWESNVWQANVPGRRISAWAGNSSQYEGFRPMIWQCKVVNGEYEVDDRGYVGIGDGVLISSGFGTPVGQQFSVGAKTYRVIHVSTGWNTNYTTWNCALAVRVQ